MQTESKRLFMAFVLTFAFLVIWTKYFTPKPPVQTEKTAITATQTPSSTPPAATNTPSSTQTTKQPQIQAPKNNIAVETFKIQTADFVSSFTNQSGGIESVQLLHYLKELGKNKEHVTVVPLVQTTHSPLLWNLSLQTSQTAAPELKFSDEQTIYQWKEKSPTQVSFVTNPTPQVQITKTYRAGSQPYILEQVLRIDNKSSSPYTVNADTSLFATHNPDAKSQGFFSKILQPMSQDVSGVSYAHEESFHWNFEDFEKSKVDVSQPPIDWSGFSSQYFLMTSIPSEGMWNDVKGFAKDGVAELKMTYPQRMLAAQSSVEYVVKLYAGPKQMEILESVHPTLDRSIQLGSWIGGLARLIHKTLALIYRFIPNYGWAIIILTILVRLVVFPLAQMQAKSMRRMTQHKPAMDALKEKYAKDREAYSRELMSYMRTHRINPASGCLPLLIQFPIFIALYRVLYNSIELRHAPFVFWIRDLSAHDPFFVLPVLVGVTFYLQTKLNPTPMADPAQQAMMKIMPIMFSVFMIFLPSGLNLYIFVSTLWGIVQQYMVQKQVT